MNNKGALAWECLLRVNSEVGTRNRNFRFTSDAFDSLRGTSEKGSDPGAYIDPDQRAGAGYYRVAPLRSLDTPNPARHRVLDVSLLRKLKGY
ncbi:hypothetical protein M2222_003310 [Bradyrhizobium elkanii]|nr:hypothetical protein [Bradyrhizobium elkanii]MCS3560988.1 hypothetical protein [Bradyrhizobium elkanii]MCW2149169.1 hypothetical protein [Bradyrhizobium elkanii]MCW2360862.1 hypothetical protein [Bradyrhizobium elkanii]MCW2372898.1 hypothetical protein [Bradyrhizobium elkanii]